MKLNKENSMDQSRRDAIRLASGLALAFSSGLLKPTDVFANNWGSDWNGAIYSAKSLEAFVIAMNGDTTTPNSPKTVTERGSAPGLKRAKENDIIIESPELAENGTNVQVTLTSKIPKTDFIALLADQNPNPVCVGFHVLPNNEPTYSVRIKVAETSSIVAVVRSEGKWFYTLRDITVMIGGCLG
jgi:sulfur-oxidizing protein SoxY